MLQQLSIQNFALIDDLKVDFEKGFSIITGETGAGKSIILGALGLILGKRADLSLLKSSEKKCIVEGEFVIDAYDLIPFFEKNDLDYESHTIIRREISPSGKSRTFINDTPVTLKIVNDLGLRLIDIHSQHETLKLTDTKFQFRIVDALAGNEKILNSYRKKLFLFKELKKELSQILDEQQQAKLQYDYHHFLLNELNEASLKVDEQQELENTLDKLNNAEAIKQHFMEAIALADRDEVGIESLLNDFKQNIAKLASFSGEYTQFFERTSSLEIEFKDILDGLEHANETITSSPEELEHYNARLRLIYNLQKKHGVGSNEDLLRIQEDLRKKVTIVDQASETLDIKNKALQKVQKELHELADTLHDRRVKVIPTLIKELEAGLESLAMPNTRFKIEISEGETFLGNGKDELGFWVAINKGADFELLKKVASGGEMSRIMLIIKALLSKHVNLPTMLFDEIDTGVSGEVSNRIASIMNDMSKNMQVISITHLPQIAAKGTHHYKVYKEEVGQLTVTNIKKLNEQERIDEVAEMLSGKELVASAIEHAKQLLG